MKKFVIILLFLVSVQQSKSQELETILLAADDASLLTENYLSPLVKGLMYNMNGGWYTTAKTHKKFGFDLTIIGNASFVPSKEQMFDFIISDYEYLELPNGETSLNTVMSESDRETEIQIRIPTSNGNFEVASFNMPGGIIDDLPINAVPTPMVQVGFGLPYKTDIKFRFVPETNFDSSVIASHIGFGLQHDLMQYFGPLEKLPLNISILGAFTTMKVAYDIEDNDADDQVSVNNGEAEFKMNTWTFQAIASLDFKVITLYGGVGYNNGKSTVKMKGDYTLTYDVEDSNGNVIGSVSESINDPINLDFNANGMRATLGTRLNIGFFKIFADYTLQEYNTASAGIAFSFR